ncbi:hypothetical protein CYMTET_14356 [Cymbomonas tetramitiformis]|uniref:Uncharacterized protein n=1 Tax=Cymbomonas tetramitiformis TaxID=36881 RepID=A0AAE0LA01_9CHLO|nr:hypothetical protein CYMTET_14356 [Cymbomonas tetramitiformis]
MTSPLLQFTIIKAAELAGIVYDTDLTQDPVLYTFPSEKKATQETDVSTAQTVVEVGPVASESLEIIPPSGKGGRKKKPPVPAPACEVSLFLKQVSQPLHLGLGTCHIAKQGRMCKHIFKVAIDKQLFSMKGTSPIFCPPPPAATPGSAPTQSNLTLPIDLLRSLHLELENLSQAALLQPLGAADRKRQDLLLATLETLEDAVDPPNVAGEAVGDPTSLEGAPGEAVDSLAEEAVGDPTSLEGAPGEAVDSLVEDGRASDAPELGEEESSFPQGLGGGGNP